MFFHKVRGNREFLLLACLFPKLTFFLKWVCGNNDCCLQQAICMQELAGRKILPFPAVWVGKAAEGLRGQQGWVELLQFSFQNKQRKEQKSLKSPTIQNTIISSFCWILSVFFLWKRPIPDHKYKASVFRHCNKIYMLLSLENFMFASCVCFKLQSIYTSPSRKKQV